jgi:hypothetical protein
VAVVKNIMDTFYTTMHQTPDMDMEEALAQLESDIDAALKDAPTP